jgi:hypothetical protein
MQTKKVIEIGAAIGAATLVGLNTLQHKLKEKEENNKTSRFTGDHWALCASLAAAGLALWEIKKHHRR